MKSESENLYALRLRFPGANREMVESILYDNEVYSFVEEEGLHEEIFLIYFDTFADGERVSAAFENSLDFVVREMLVLPHNDWERNWKKYWRSIEVSEGLAIVPTWQQYCPKNGQKVLLLDTTMAFGTGAHPTTRLVLRELDTIIKQSQPRSFLDVGCGSGILSIAAAMLGVRRVCGIDIENDAPRVARENAEQNSLNDIEFSNTPIAQINETFELIAANILSSVLAELFLDLRRCLHPQGILILSGILETEVPSFLKQFELQTARLSFEDGWACLVVRI